MVGAPVIGRGGHTAPGEDVVTPFLAAIEAVDDVAVGAVADPRMGAGAVMAVGMHEVDLGGARWYDSVLAVLWFS